MEPTLELALLTISLRSVSKSKDRVFTLILKQEKNQQATSGEHLAMATGLRNCPWENQSANVAKFDNVLNVKNQPVHHRLNNSH